METQELAKKLIDLNIKLSGNSSRIDINRWIVAVKNLDEARKTKNACDDKKGGAKCLT